MAVKNYKAPVAKEVLIEDKIRVSDYMVTRNKLIAFFPDYKVVEAMQILVTHNISGAPVIDENDKLLGMISEGDCMRKIANSRYYNVPLHDQTIGEYMEPIVDFIDGNQNIFDVATKFCTSRRNRFPVLENGKVIGQISRKDILKAALEME